MRVLVLPLAAALSIVTACNDARTLCEAAAECDDENFGFPVDGVGNSDDSVNVCVAQFEAQQRALRANEEEECLALADAVDRLQACLASEYRGGEDECDLFTDPDVCDDEREDVQDAQTDINGDECSANED